MTSDERHASFVSWASLLLESTEFDRYETDYKLALSRSFNEIQSAGLAETERRVSGRPNNDDLRTMHSYRDAIRRSAGAYVLYPGDDNHQPSSYRQYHEVLPGVGAFVLRPTASGESTVAASGHLVDFLSDVIDHAAAQGTGRERARFWEDVAYRDRRSGEDSQRIDFHPELQRPPADAQVLLGFVRSEQHRAWVRENGIYNLRADPDRRGSVGIGSPEIRADYLALYDANSDVVDVFELTGALYIQAGDELRAAGYPTGYGSSGTGNLYLCLEIGNVVDLPIAGDVARALAADASPTRVSWKDIAAVPPLHRNLH